MEVLNENPTIVQTGWEKRETTIFGKEEPVRECFLIAAVLKDNKPTLWMANVMIKSNDEKGLSESQKKELEETEIKYRLMDILDDIKNLK